MAATQHVSVTSLALPTTTAWAQDSVSSVNTNSTFSVINQFKLDEAKSVRSSTIILASFNTVVAFATAAGIMFDCYLAAKRARAKEDPKWQLKKITAWNCIQEPEVYPLLLSSGIVVQGIIFAVSQSQGMDSLFQTGCTLISGFMWPAIFIVPYLQLVLGLEVTVRSLRTSPFPPRSKWNITTCLGLVATLLLPTVLVGILIPAPDLCYSTFLWFVANWAEGAFAVFLTTAAALAICTIIIPLRLSRFSMIEDLERISASRMVYYLVAAVVTNALLVPYFLTLAFENPSFDDDGIGMTLDMIATVVANVSGLMTGGLYLFLRRSTLSTIQPKEKFPESERLRLKNKIRIGSPNQMDFNDHMTQPVTGPGSFNDRNSLENAHLEEKAEREFWAGLQSSNNNSPHPPNPLRSNLPWASVASQDGMGASQYTNTHARRPSASYSIFPSTGWSGKGPGSNATTAGRRSEAEETVFSDSSFNMLKPPPPVTSPGGLGRHQRNSSVGSSATVQIGLRFSDVKNVPPPAKRKDSRDSKRPNLFELPPPQGSVSLYPSPLATPSRAVKSPPPVARTTRASSVYSDRLKDLPAIPLQYQQQQQQQQHQPQPQVEEKADDITLSPTVYDPSSPSKSTNNRNKTPSPRGVGFQVPRRTAVDSDRGSTTSSVPPPQYRDRPTSTAKKGDWI